MTAPAAPEPPASRFATENRFDPGRTRGHGAGDIWRSLTTAIRLGWEMEANWTDPLLFAIYSVAKPLASVLLLVLMVEIVSGGGRAQVRDFVIVGSALWSLAMNGLAGFAWSVLDDRERYRMLKYIYVSPSAFSVVLVGRGTARIAVGAMGAAITLVVGFVFLGVGFDPGRVDWVLAAVATILGIGAIVVIGILMAAVCLQTRQESWSYPEAVAGSLFLVSGVVFPLRALPEPLQAIGLVSPLSWWVDGVRRSLIGGVSSVGGEGSLFERLTGSLSPSGAELVLALLATGGLATLGSIAVFRVSERRARDRGLIDRTTGS